MKKYSSFFFVFFCLAVLHISAQNCSYSCSGYPPLQDLGTGYWRGFQGGLYPNGSNSRPPLHNLSGMSIAQNIVPLDTAGNVDVANGKIVWLSIGMSNTTFESRVFIKMTDTFSLKNPQLVLVDGAQGGRPITVINNPAAGYWTEVNNRLAAKSVTPKQVQVIWFKQLQRYPTDTSFATYPDSLKEKFKIALQIIKNKFPNAKLAYLSNRIYGGYAKNKFNPEPFAYYSGWSIKRLIEEQVNGDPSLGYEGISPCVPWLAWGPDLWADGALPRSDGLTWICPTDYTGDGLHPSAIGCQKLADMLFKFFTTDDTTRPWFFECIK